MTPVAEQGTLGGGAFLNGFQPSPTPAPPLPPASLTPVAAPLFPALLPRSLACPVPSLTSCLKEWPIPIFSLTSASLSLSSLPLIPILSSPSLLLFPLTFSFFLSPSLNVFFSSLLRLIPTPSSPPSSLSFPSPSPSPHPAYLFLPPPPVCLQSPAPVSLQTQCYRTSIKAQPRRPDPSQAGEKLETDK